VFVNLGVLAFFKYGGFALENFRVALAGLGIDYVPPALDIILPVGISFYTFQSMSYTIDVYRRQIRPDWSFLDFALFVSFFPQLVAGPIVRASEFLPQLDVPRRLRADNLAFGLSILVFGLAMKVVLADALFAPLVDDVFSDPSAHGALDAWVATFAFSGQIYGDFAGYSLCAIGLARCFDLDFPLNFRSPFAAIGFSDFWRRWHISLSTWLRDYLYVPLGGNRGSTLATYRNLALTMVIGGLWHGASWLFVLWGALHGTWLIIERLLRSGRKSAGALGPFARSSAMLATFLLVSLTWIPFRAADWGAMLAVLRALFDPSTPVALEPIAMILAMATMTGMLFMQARLRDSSFFERYADLSPTLQATLLSVALLAIYLCSGGQARAFIYFQF
jgi:D-alanyl-lipoteichoic acid acyltransferase DltB (MBOAT superfamily)